MSLLPNTENPDPRAAQIERYIPFVAHVRIVPDLGTGKRWTMIRDLQKKARRIQQSIEAAIADGILSVSINIGTPVAHSFQFGNTSAKATIVGFVQINRSGGQVHPTTDIDEIHSGTDQGEPTALYSVNKGGSLAAGQDPQGFVDDEVNFLRNALLDALDQNVNPNGLITIRPEDLVHIEYNGVKYGIKGFGTRSFPR